ncbi:DUF6744 family protein [Kitasatospora kifunensis]|uniref:Uncharacterized protein n=1 Tax=Kitasatospora kifunensis TaxID=58351 RepID=A0A7W7VZT3_KITKI|nr:DUF6744 family protein [Kitasatospora kifunensis]MBB4929127.1 hypothetical protein [Kitasatospora kifunensis]
MTAQQPEQQLPDLATGDSAFDSYTAAMTGDQSPLLGHLVLYSIFDSEITRDDLERWFNELNLDTDFLPPDLRADDAYEKVTGADGGVRRTYPLDDPTATSRPGRRRRRTPSEFNRSAVLMVRPVRRDAFQIVRHLVREVRDAKKTSLTYDTRLAVCVFHRDNTGSKAAGAGTLQVEPDHQAIAALPEAERTVVHEMLADIEKSFRLRCTYLTGDKLRSMIRQYVEHLNAVRVRPTGGVYYVHRQHAETLTALRELVGRFGPGSNLFRIPLPDQEEMRQMIIGAFTTKAKDDLDRLAQEIAEAQRDAKPEEVSKLHQRFTALKAATAEHSELLSTSLDDTEAALHLVELQLTSLLIAAPGDDAE